MLVPSFDPELCWNEDFPPLVAQKKLFKENTSSKFGAPKNKNQRSSGPNFSNEPPDFPDQLATSSAAPKSPACRYHRKKTDFQDPS